MNYLLMFCFLSFELFGNYENTVHYIWMGDINTPPRMEVATLGPDRLDHLIRFFPIENEITINFWVRDSTKKMAENLFSGTKIKVSSIDDYLSGRIPSKFFIPEEIAQLSDIIEEMEHQRYYSYQADVLGVFLVAELGGYYFDTTTYFYDLPNLFNNNMTRRIGVIFRETLKEAIEIFNLYNCSFWSAIDLQIFAAPIRGDDVFISSIKKILTTYAKKGLLEVSPPHPLVMAVFEKIFGQKPHNFADLIFIRNHETKSYENLNLLKINGKTWHSPGETGRVSEIIKPEVLEKIHNLKK